MSAFHLHYTRKISRFAALGLFLISLQIARADNSKISPDLLPLLQQPSNSIKVIVQYNSQPSGGGGLLGPVFNLLDGLVNIVFSLIPAVAAILHPADV
ncbi:MAG TPA: hypothetical protein VGZ26_08415, partial [Pirellulales bacterium]|nr:hypothetical protein [Pirellulales bacterium]